MNNRITSDQLEGADIFRDEMLKMFGSKDASDGFRKAMNDFVCDVMAIIYEQMKVANQIYLTEKEIDAMKHSYVGRTLNV